MFRKVIQASLTLAAGLALAFGLTAGLSYSMAQAGEIEPAPGDPAAASPKNAVELDASSVPLDSLVHATTGNPDNLDPALDYETLGAQVIQQIYDPLLIFKREKGDEFIPMLATGWSIGPDGRTYIFEIRRGVSFHNGNALTPSDVAYTFQRAILQGGTNSPQWLYTEALFGVGIYDVCSLLDDSLCDDRSALQAYQLTHPDQVRQVCTDLTGKIVADDAHGTVTFNLPQPWGPLLATLTSYTGSIIDREWSIQNGAWNGDCNTWQNYYAATGANSPLRQIANGTGPFKLDHWTPYVEIVLDRNPNYWNLFPLWEGGPFGPAAFATVTMTLQTDNASNTQLLLDGEADLANIDNAYISQLDLATAFLFDGQDSLIPTLVNPAGTLKKYTGGLSPSAFDAFFTYDIATGGPRNYIGSGLLDGNGIPPDFFTDIHVRKGFNYAFDWTDYINTVYGGGAIQRRGPIIKPLIGYSDAQPAYAYNPTLALAELNQAWSGQVAANGFSLTLAYSAGRLDQQALAEILKAGIEALDSSFHINLVEVSAADYGSDARNGYLPIFRNGWTQDIAHPHNWVQPWLVGLFADRQRLPSATQNAYQALISNCVILTGDAARVCYENIQNQTYLDALDIFLTQALLRNYTSVELHGFYTNNSRPGPRYYDLYKSPPPAVVAVEPTTAQTLDFTTAQDVATSVSLPAGAVEQSLQLAAFPDVLAFTSMADFLLSDITFDLKAFTPDGEQISPLTFEAPVILTIEYGANRFYPGEEQELLLLWWDGNQWVDAACGAYVRDPVNHILQVPICHLSTFAVGQQSQLYHLPLVFR